VLAKITATILLGVFPISVLPGLAFLSVYKARTNPERAYSELGAGTSKERQWENPNYLKNTKQQPFLDGDRV